MGTIKRNFYNNITPTGKFDSADLTGTIPATNVADASLTNVTSVPASVGDFVQKVASDPTPVGAGDVWYNTTSNALKSVVSSEAWSSGAPLITARRLLASASSSTQTAAIGAGGYIDGTGDQNKTEEYNGSGWANGGNINTSRREFDGAGTQTSTVIFGGRIGASQQQTQTEEYDGSTWTSSNPLNFGRQRLGGAGTQTAGLAFSGIGNTSKTEEYDGTSWTAGGDMGTGRYALGASGIQTAALAAGGNPYTSVSEEYNGTAWTSGGSLNTARMFLRSSGTQSATLAFGGLISSPAKSNATESYDGTSWTTSSTSLATARAEMGRAGGTTSALSFGGFTQPGVTTVTEEYNSSINVITSGAWSSGGNLPVGKQGFGGAGTRSASLIFGGYIGGPGVTGYVATTEEYNGASWSSGGNLPISRSNAIGFGTQTTGVAFGGLNQPPSGGTFLSSGDHYDGSTWTATPNNYPSNAANASSCGTQTAGLGANGYNGTAYLNTSNEYDGTSWTAGGTVPVSWSGRGIGGIQTSAIIFGGTDGGSPFPASGQSQSDEYNGSTWTTVASLPSGRIFPSGAGNTSADNVRAMGGRLASPAGTPTAEHNIYDGTVWSTQPSITTARQQAGITVYSSTPEAMITGGNDPGGSFLTATEEFTGETSAANVVTISSS